MIVTNYGKLKFPTFYFTEKPSLQPEVANTQGTSVVTKPGGYSMIKTTLVLTVFIFCFFTASAHAITPSKEKDIK